MSFGQFTGQAASIQIPTDSFAWPSRTQFHRLSEISRRFPLKFPDEVIALVCLVVFVLYEDEDEVIILSNGCNDDVES